MGRLADSISKLIKDSRKRGRKTILNGTNKKRIIRRAR